MGGLEFSALPPNIATGLETPAVPPNEDVDLDPSADLEPELVPPNVKKGGPAGVGETVLSKVVVLADVRVGFSGVDVEASLSVTTGFPKRFVAEAEGKLSVELPNADTVPGGEGLAG